AEMFVPSRGGSATGAPTRDLYARVATQSKVTVRAPDRPARTPSQNSSTPFPIEVSGPTPVIATLWRSGVMPPSLPHLADVLRPHGRPLGALERRRELREVRERPVHPEPGCGVRVGLRELRLDLGGRDRAPRLSEPDEEELVGRQALHPALDGGLLALPLLERAIGFLDPAEVGDVLA